MIRRIKSLRNYQPETKKKTEGNGETQITDERGISSRSTRSMASQSTQRLGKSNNYLKIVLWWPFSVYSTGFILNII